MAKSKVINTVLQLKDQMSGGLLKAAKNTKGVTKEMQTATRQVVAFKNKTVSAVSEASKKLAGLAVAGAGAAATGLAAMAVKAGAAADDLNTLAKQSGFSTADIQQWQYASDMIDVSVDDIVGSAKKMKKNMVSTSKDTISAWKSIGVSTKDSNGQLRNSTTVFYEVLDGLSKIQNETERDVLAMQLFGKSADSLAGIIDDGGASLREYGDQAKKAGAIVSQDLLDGANKLNDQIDVFKATASGVFKRTGSVLATALAPAIETVGTKLNNAFGGSVLDWFYGKVDGVAARIQQWQSDGTIDRLADKLSGGIAWACDKASQAFEWLKANGDKIVPTIKRLAIAFASVKVAKFASDVISAGVTIAGFTRTVYRLVIAKGDEILIWGKATAAVAANKVALLGHKVAGGISWVVTQIHTLGMSTAAWIGNTVQLGLNKAALLGHKVVGGVTWIATQAIAVGAASAAWIHNTAVMVLNKAGLAASAIASGIATGATATLTAAQWALNAAFVATPIGWIVLGLASVVAAGVALYKNWDTVKAKASELWDKARSVFGGIKATIVGAFDQAKETVSGFFSWLDQKIESIPLLGSLYKGGKAVVNGSVDLITSALGNNALGTSYWRGGLTRVNERGGEVMNLPSGTQIIPHDVSKRMGGQSVDVKVYIQGNVIGNDQFADQVGERVTRKIVRALANT